MNARCQLLHQVSVYNTIIIIIILTYAYREIRVPEAQQRTQFL